MKKVMTEDVKQLSHQQTGVDNTENRDAAAGHL